MIVLTFTRKIFQVRLRRPSETRIRFPKLPSLSSNLLLHHWFLLTITATAVIVILGLYLVKQNMFLFR
jgi:hypothetical protein